MPIEIEGPDGLIIEFPEGTSPDVMKRALQKRYGPPPAEVARGLTAYAAEKTGVAAQRQIAYYETERGRARLTAPGWLEGEDFGGSVTSFRKAAPVYASTPAPAPKGAPVVTERKRTAGERLTDRVEDAFQRGPWMAGARAAANAALPGDLAGGQMVAAERERREALAIRDQADSFTQVEGLGGKALHGVSALTGTIVGSIADPIQAVTLPIGGGSTILTRALLQGGLNAGMDAAQQGLDVSSKTQDRYDLLQTAGAAALGAGISVGADVAPKAARSLLDLLRKPEADVAPQLRMADMIERPALHEGQLADLRPEPVVAPKETPVVPVEQPKVEPGPEPKGDLAVTPEASKASGEGQAGWDDVDWGKMGSTRRAEAATAHLETLRKLIKPEHVARFVKHLKEPEGTLSNAADHLNPDYVDWSKFDADPSLIEGWARARAEIFRDLYDGAGDATKTWAQTDRAARYFGTSLSQVAKTHADVVGEGGLAARLGALQQFAVEHDGRFAEFLTAFRAKQAKGEITPNDIADLAAFTQKTAMMDAMAAGAASEVARSMNYLKRIKRGREMGNDLEALMETLNKGGDINPDDLAPVVDRMTKAFKKGGGAALRGEVRKMSEFGVWDYAGYILTGNLLSGFSTHLRNLVGTPLHAVLSVGERYIAAGIGMARGRAGGVERVTFREAVAYTSGMGQAWMEAFRIAAKAAKAGASITDGESSVLPTNRTGWVPFKIDEARLARWGDHRAWATNPLKHGLHPLLDIPTATLFSLVRTFGYRPSVAADEFYKALGRRMQLNALSVREAAYQAALVEPGQSEAAFQATLRAIREEPTDAAVKEAKVWFAENGASRDDPFDAGSAHERYANVLRSLDIRRLAEDHARLLTFQKSGPVVEAWDRALRTLPLVKYFAVNFVRTPLALLRSGMVDRNPVLAFTLKDNRETLSYLGAALRDSEVALQRGGAEADLVLARMTMGAGVLTWAWSMWANGDLVGRQGEPGEAKNGILDYSIRIPGTQHWFQFSSMSPIAEPLGLVADFAQAMKERDLDDDHGTALMGALLAAVSNNALNKTFMAGISDLMDIMEGPGVGGGSDEARGQMAGETAAGMAVGRLVPLSSLLRSAAQEQDPVVRDARTFLERVKATIPGLTDELPAKRDWLGRQIIRQEGQRGMFQAWKTSRLTDDEVDAEIARLSDAVGFHLKAPQRKFNGQEITREEFSRMLEVQGQEYRDPATGLNMEEAVRALIESPDYDQMEHDAQRGASIKKIVSAYRAAANAEMRDPASDLYWPKVAKRTGAAKLASDAKERGWEQDDVLSAGADMGLEEDELQMLKEALGDNP